MAVSQQRGLVPGEVSLATAAFGSKIDYGKVKISDGPANHPFAHMAFAKGNPAITIGSTIYFKIGYCTDFSAAGEDRRSFIHEMTHVWQYQAMGMPAFFLRYGADFLGAGGDADAMYEYPEAQSFADAMIEAQAEMVANYSTALWSGAAAERTKRARNLAGSGVYGL